MPVHRADVLTRLHRAEGRIMQQFINPAAGEVAA
jgi:hypothetical protein